MALASPQCPELLSKCDAALGACGEAVTAKNKEIQLCRLGLTQSTERQGQLLVELDDANAKLSSPIRNPWITSLAGALLGIVLVGWATRGK